jgi:hypothetical protein
MIPTTTVDTAGQPVASARLRFPDWFVLRSVHSSLPDEGAWNEDGCGPSIWDTFTREPGRIVDGTDADVACDHYHRDALVAERIWSPLAPWEGPVAQAAGERSGPCPSRRSSVSTSKE